MQQIITFEQWSNTDLSCCQPFEVRGSVSLKCVQEGCWMNSHAANPAEVNSTQKKQAEQMKKNMTWNQQNKLQPVRLCVQKPSLSNFIDSVWLSGAMGNFSIAAFEFLQRLCDANYWQKRGKKTQRKTDYCAKSYDQKWSGNESTSKHVENCFWKQNKHTGAFQYLNNISINILHLRTLKRFMDTRFQESDRNDFHKRTADLKQDWLLHHDESCNASGSPESREASFPFIWSDNARWINVSLAALQI